MIVLRALGGLSFTEHDKSVGIGSTKAALCLLYLRHNAHRKVSRSELLDVMWSADTARARHSLSQILYSLRRRFSTLALEASAEDILLDTTLFHYDVEDLNRAIKGKLYAIATEAYRGRFLQDLRTFPTPEFEHWADLVGRMSASAASSAFKHQLKHAEAAGNWDSVENWAARLLEIDPLDEDAHAHLIRASAALLGVEAASRLAKDVRTQFAADLGGIRSTELRETCDRYADSDAVLVGVRSSSHEPPIHGRTKEFRSLTESWYNASRGIPQIVRLSGPAGIGKTRLSNHFLKWCAIRGSRILMAKASHSDTHIPYAIASQVLRSGIRKGDVEALQEPWRSWLTSIIPEHVRPVPPDARETHPPGQREIFESIGRLLKPLCNSAPLMIFVDDANLADNMSAWLLHSAFHRLAGEKLVLVLASRQTGDGLPEQLRLLIHSTNESRQSVVPLGPVDPDSGGAIVRDVLAQTDGSMSAAACAEIVEYSKGNPYFIIEAAASHASEMDGRESEEAKFRGTYGILTTVRLLPTSAMEVLRALAVLGFRAPIGLVKSTADCSGSDFAEAVSFLRSKRLVRDGCHFLEFEHDIVREAVIADLSDGTGRRLNRRAANAISNMASAPLGRLAIHYTAAGLSGHAYSAAMAAAQEAQSIHSPDDVQFYLRLAISRATNSKERLVALGTLVEHFCTLELYYEARGILAKAPDVWSCLQSDTAQMLRIDSLLVDPSYSAADLLSHIESAGKSGSEMQDGDAHFRLLRSVFAVAHGVGSPLVKDILHRLVDNVDNLGRTPEAAKLLACMARVWVTYEGGNEALDLANQAVTVAAETHEASSIALSLIARGTVNMLLGNLTSAEVDFTMCTEVVREPNLLAMAWRLTINRSVLLIETGRPGEASEALERIVGSHVPMEQLLIRGNMALAALEMNDDDRLLRRIRELRGINGPLQLGWVDSFADCMEANYLLRNGRNESAHVLIAGLAEVERHATSKALGPEPSYAQALIGEWIAISSTKLALKYLEAAAASHRGRNVLGELRLRAVHARVLSSVNEVAARRELTELIERCRLGGALTLMRQCETVKAVLGLATA